MLQRKTRELLTFVWGVVVHIIKNRLLASAVVPPAVRPRLLGLFDVDARGARIMSNVFIGGGPLTVGTGSFINIDCLLDTSAGIAMGRNVRLGPRVTMITASHKIGLTEETRTRRTRGDHIRAPIHIGDNVWIAANVTILPGVTIGSGAVIAAGSVVNRDCEANSLYGGVPVRKIRDLPTSALPAQNSQTEHGDSFGAA